MRDSLVIIAQSNCSHSNELLIICTIFTTYNSCGYKQLVELFSQLIAFVYSAMKFPELISINLHV